MRGSGEQPQEVVYVQTSLEPGAHREEPTAKGLENKLFLGPDGPLGTAYLEQMQIAKGTEALKTELILMAHRLKLMA